jgi:hypothetical protein
LVTVDVQTLGEYQTSISRIEVTEERTGRTIWKVLPEGHVFQINTFQLKAGANDVKLEPAWGYARAVVPHGETSFFLHPGSTYQVEVCGRRCRHGIFQLKPRASPVPSPHPSH